MSGILQTLFLGAAAAVTDAFFNLVTLLLNTTATNGAQNNTFLDSSTNNFTITRNGNTTQGTFTPFSQTGWSAYFGAASALTTPSSSAFAYGTGAFTIELWIYETTAPTSSVSVYALNGTNNLNIQRSAGGFYNIYDGGDRVSTTTIVSNQWNHIAVVRQAGGQLNLYANGVSVLSYTSSVNYTATTFSVAGSGTFPFYGYASNVRVLNGIALYTSNFTPPTAPLTAVTGTSLLTCQSNRFVDNSTNAFALTAGGTPSVQAFSPFAPTAAYDTAVVGGSGYFDGTGDYLTVGSGTDVDLGTSDFMIEFWYYCLQNGTYVSGVISKRVGGVASGWGMTTSGFVCDMAGTWYDSWANPFWVGSTQNSGFNSGTSLQKLNQWTHVVVTRQGTDARWFVNGQLLGYFSRTGAIQQLTGSPLAVGLNGTTTEQPFIGFLSNCRVVVGSVPTGYQTSSTTLNTQIFTPPTAPITTTSQGATSSNVKYIGNFTNAGIFDAAAKNDLETVGNAQVSTTQAKFGTTSAAFDGTGDNLKLKLTNAVGSGDYTIEGFFYASGTGIQYLFDMRETSQYIGSYIIGSSTTLYVNFGTTLDITASTSFALNTWNHMAFVRSGSGSNNTSVYLNGSRVYQRTDTTDYSIVPNLFIGCENSGNYYLNGYVDEFRITKGYARYSGSTYTVPAAAFPLL